MLGGGGLAAVQQAQAAVHDKALSNGVVSQTGMG